MGPPSRWQRPTPSVTKIVWPCGWVCQAVRAPGVKWTSAAAKVDDASGAATASRWTSPVNQSAGPLAVPRSSARVIFMVLSAPVAHGVTSTLMDSREAIARYPSGTPSSPTVRSNTRPGSIVPSRMSGSSSSMYARTGAGPPPTFTFL